ncbi:mechanosensitive ion channel family protein [Luteimicrobium subarcticum]|uniref:Mechanosensitive ion channel-like protein n=1 Tax=Luteimicrobium subarcticum TaxID=620910 RepID=A0A2M8W6V3_9MICO|nr:mechanosensitive ion channel domain-containing protein [Luteimicrobium subarcticum]PJI86665.1 mechanosensitive ion channel-like protein [Luteimicrobium subarcticum]
MNVPPVAGLAAVSVPSLDDVSGKNLTWWGFAFAIATMVIAWLVARYAGRGVMRLPARFAGVSESLAATTARLVRYFVLLLGVGVALAFLGADVQPLIAGAIIVAVVLVIALRGVADNFGASVILQTRQPIRVGDDVESQGYRGTVRELNARSVVIRTADGVAVHLPNSDVLGEPLLNYSEYGARRDEVEVWLEDPDLDVDVETVRAAVVAATGVARHPEPVVVVVTGRPASATLRARFWFSPRAPLAVTSEVVTAVSAALRGRAGDWAVDGPPRPPAPRAPAPRQR